MFQSPIKWIGHPRPEHPRCVAIHRQQQPYFAPTGNDRVLLMPSSMASLVRLRRHRPALYFKTFLKTFSLFNFSYAASRRHEARPSAIANRVTEPSCSSEDRGGCEHVCSQSAEPDSNIRCLCYRGFRLDADGKSCVVNTINTNTKMDLFAGINNNFFSFSEIDEDECVTANDGCDGTCTN